METLSGIKSAREGPLELGYDKWTKKFYGNKEFLINSIKLLIGGYRTYKHSYKKGGNPFSRREENQGPKKQSGN